MTDVAGDARALQKVLDDLNVVLSGHLADLWDASGHSPAIMIDQAPAVIRAFLDTAATITAQWYDDLAPRADYHASEAYRIPDERIETSIRWAMFSGVEEGEATELEKLAGATERMIFDASRQTTIANAGNEGAKWARLAGADACPWCSVLALRGAVYKSEESALASHDRCQCVPVVERPGVEYQRPAYMDAWEDEYVAARRGIRDGDYLAEDLGIAGADLKGKDALDHIAKYMRAARRLEEQGAGIGEAA